MTRVAFAIPVVNVDAATFVIDTSCFEGWNKQTNICIEDNPSTPFYEESKIDTECLYSETSPTERVMLVDVRIDQYGNRTTSYRNGSNYVIKNSNLWESVEYSNSHSKIFNSPLSDTQVETRTVNGTMALVDENTSSRIVKFLSNDEDLEFYKINLTDCHSSTTNTFDLSILSKYEIDIIFTPYGENESTYLNVPESTIVVMAHYGNNPVKYINLVSFYSKSKIGNGVVCVGSNIDQTGFSLTSYGPGVECVIEGAVGQSQACSMYAAILYALMKKYPGLSKWKYIEAIRRASSLYDSGYSWTNNNWNPLTERGYKDTTEYGIGYGKLNIDTLFSTNPDTIDTYSGPMNTCTVFEQMWDVDQSSIYVVCPFNSEFDIYLFADDNEILPFADVEELENCGIISQVHHQNTTCVKIPISMIENGDKYFCFAWKNIESGKFGRIEQFNIFNVMKSSGTPKVYDMFDEPVVRSFNIVGGTVGAKEIISFSGDINPLNTTYETSGYTKEDKIVKLAISLTNSPQDRIVASLRDTIGSSITSIFQIGKQDTSANTRWSDSVTWMEEASDTETQTILVKMNAENPGRYTKRLYLSIRNSEYNVDITYTASEQVIIVPSLSFVGMSGLELTELPPGYVTRTQLFINPRNISRELIVTSVDTSDERPVEPIITLSTDGITYSNSSGWAEGELVGLDDVPSIYIKTTIDALEHDGTYIGNIVFTSDGMITKNFPYSVNVVSDDYMNMTPETATANIVNLEPAIVKLKLSTNIDFITNDVVTISSNDSARISMCQAAAGEYEEYLTIDALTLSNENTIYIKVSSDTEENFASQIQVVFRRGLTFPIDTVYVNIIGSSSISEEVPFDWRTQVSELSDTEDMVILYKVIADCLDKSIDNIELSNHFRRKYNDEVKMMKLSSRQRKYSGGFIQNG